jgi:hypothetical protein
MALSGLDIFKLVTLVTVVSCQQDSEERYEYYRKKYPQVRWYTTQEPDYYDLLQTPGPTPTPDPYAAKHFDNSTEKFMGQIIFREFMPLKLTIKRHYRLQNVLRTNFEGAEAFEVFIVSKMFRGVPDWKVVSSSSSMEFLDVPILTSLLIFVTFFVSYYQAQYLEVFKELEISVSFQFN